MDYSTACYYSTRLIAKLELLDIENKLDFTLINEAIYWAKKYHDGQFRKSGEPFYTHPLEVAYMVSDYNLKTDIIVTAILHDIVEDTEVIAEMILDTFGHRIEEMVDRLTRDRPDGSKLNVKEILNNAYQKEDREVLLIKLVDRLHNLQTINFKSPEKMKKMIDETFYKFIILSIHLGDRIIGMSKIEESIAELCYKNLPIKQRLAWDEEMIFEDNFQLPSLIFQNDVSQKHILYLLEP